MTRSWQTLLAVAHLLFVGLQLPNALADDGSVAANPFAKLKIDVATPRAAVEKQISALLNRPMDTQRLGTILKVVW